MNVTELEYKQALLIIKLYKKQQKISDAPKFEVDEFGNCYDLSGNILKQQIKTSKTGRKRVTIKGYAVASVVAEKYCDNKKGYKRIIFKDDNPLNCAASNLIWVSDEIFYLNIKVRNPAKCPMGDGRNKIIESRETAILKAKDVDLIMYYTTQDESILHRLWSKINSEMIMKGWKEVSTECYLYFMDRCKRNSLFGNPYAFVIAMAQKRIKQYYKTLNTSLAKDSKRLDKELIRTW